MLLDERAHALEVLATHLTRVLPASHRAGAALVVAVAAYLRGDGLLAAAALDIARAADPRRRVVGLLTHAIDARLRPEELRQILTEAVTTSG